MTTNQIVHKLERLEEQMGARDLPPLDIEIVFVEPVEGVPGGRIKRVVKLSELTSAMRGPG